MSIIVSDLSFHYSGLYPLFNNLNFSVENQKKVSIIGNNGTGKSTLLKLIAGKMEPSGGSILSSSLPYYVPQHTGELGKTIAEVLGVDKKLAALRAIEGGSILQSDYDTLADDWEIDSKCSSALSYWQLPELLPDSPAGDLSGGELTKVFLAGLMIHSPEIILLDEPTNHLDRTGRNLLYRYIRESKATIVIVSHDIALLDQLDTTYELSTFGIRLYGGNYSFYREQKEIQVNALDEDIQHREKALRIARKQAQEVKQRQEKRLQHGKKNKDQVPRIMVNTLRNSSENTASRLQGKHVEIIHRNQSELTELRQKKERLKELKIDFDNTSLHSGKLLVEAVEVNFSYSQQADMLWEKAQNLKLYSNDRIQILGDNGSGKTTLINLLLGSLSPSEGELRRQDFNWIYLDQNYTQVDTDCTVEELAGKYNIQNLEEHEVKLRLNRFLFPSGMWSKKCRELSGGEKMRLYLCCLMISNQTPDLIILDEPTNNLDISSLQILTQTIKNYRGSLLVVSHDTHFVNEIGVTDHWTIARS